MLVVQINAQTAWGYLKYLGLFKMLYLAMMDITKKWTGRRRDWSQIRAQLDIFFEERLEKYMY